MALATDSTTLSIWFGVGVTDRVTAAFAAFAANDGWYGCLFSLSEIWDMLCFDASVD